MQKTELWAVTKFCFCLRRMYMTCTGCFIKSSRFYMYMAKLISKTLTWICTVAPGMNLLLLLTLAASWLCWWRDFELWTMAYFFLYQFVVVFFLINTLAFFGMCIARRRNIDHKICYSPIFLPLCDLAFFPSFSFHGMLFVLQTLSLPWCNLTIHLLVSCTMQHAESRCGGELEVSYNACTGFKQTWLVTSWITSKQLSRSILSWITGGVCWKCTSPILTAMDKSSPF